MALIKDIPTEYGASAAYWHISTTHIDWKSPRAHVELAGFITEDARRAGCAPISRSAFVFDVADWPFDPERSVVADAYAAVKAMPAFAGAQDA